MSTKLDEAIQAVLAASQPTGCWATRLDGDAAEFIRRLKEEETKGIRVSRTETLRFLRDVWNVTVGEDSLRNHMKGRCSCG